MGDTGKDINKGLADYAVSQLKPGGETPFKDRAKAAEAQYTDKLANNTVEVTPKDIDNLKKTMPGFDAAAESAKKLFDTAEENYTGKLGDAIVNSTVEPTPATKGFSLKKLFSFGKQSK